MKFTVERRVLLRMVEQVRAKLSGAKKDDPGVKLSACAARVFVAGSGTVAGHEALVFADGECSVPGRQFSRILKSYGGKKNLTIEADEGGLRIGGFSMAVGDYSPVTIPPAHFQVFAVTDLDVTSREKTESESKTEHRIGEFSAPATHETKPKLRPEEHVVREPSKQIPADEDAQAFEDKYPAMSCLVEPMQRFARTLCFLDQATPKMVVGLGRALHAFDRLPVSTKGVDVFFTAYERLRIPDGYRETGLYISISERALEVGDRVVGCEGTWKKESLIPAYSAHWIWSETIPEENDWDGEDVGGWLNRLHRFFSGKEITTIIVAVVDRSEPSCLG